jgi:hypothetical protein
LNYWEFTDTKGMQGRILSTRAVATLSFFCLLVTLRVFGQETINEVGGSSPVSDRGIMSTGTISLHHCKYKDKKESQWKQIVFEKDAETGQELPFFYYFTQAPSDTLPKSTRNVKKNRTKDKTWDTCTNFEMTGMSSSQIVPVTGCEATKVCMIKIDAIANDLSDLTCERNPDRVQSVKLRGNRLLRFPSGGISGSELSVVFHYHSKEDPHPALVQFSEKSPKSISLVEPVDEDSEGDENEPFARGVFEREPSGDYIFKKTGRLDYNLDSIAYVAKTRNGKDNLKEVFKATGIEPEMLNRLCRERKEKLVLNLAARAKKYLPKHYADDIFKRGY